MALQSMPNYTRHPPIALQSITRDRHRRGHRFMAESLHNSLNSLTLGRCPLD